MSIGSEETEGAAEDEGATEEVEAEVVAGKRKKHPH